MSINNKYGVLAPKVLASLGLVMSLIILLFWYIHFDNLATVADNQLLLISYKGALCFLLGNLALLNACWWRIPYVTQLCAIVLIILSIALFLNRFLEIYTPIMALFSKADLVIRPIIQRPRPFIPNSLLFLLISIPLLLTQRKNNTTLMTWIMLGCTIIVFMLSFASLLAWILNLSFTYKWGVFPMRAYMSIGLILLSSGTYMHVYYYIKGQTPSFFPRHEPKILFATCASMITILWLALRVQAQTLNTDPNFSFFSLHDTAVFHHIMWALAMLLALFASKALGLIYSLSRYAKKLRQTESILYTAEHIATIGTWVWRLDTNVIWCTPETLQILEYDDSNQTLTPNDFFDYFKTEKQEDLKTKASLLTASQPRLKGCYTIHTKKDHSKTLTIEAQLSRFQDNTPIEITGTLQDVTEKKKLELQLLQIQKIETIAQLAGGIAHDFNNLLMVIRGNLELLNMSITEPKLTKFITSAQSATNHGAALTKKLLGFSRKQLLNPQVVSIPELLKKFNLLLNPLIPATIKVTQQVPDTLWHIWVDEGQLENALLNLAVNAKDAMPNGGKLFFGFENYTQMNNDNSHHDFQKLPAGDYVQIEIIDTGIGMTPEVLERAFEAFFTTKEVGKGTGLGLAMVHGFAKQSNGLVTLYSEAGHGTTVKLYLPRATITQDPVTAPPLFSPDVTNATLLVVEDEAALREITVTYLKQAGFTILAANNGPEALKQLQAHPEITLILTDLIMPGGMTGLDLAKEARRHTPSLKIILISGYAPDTLDLSQYPDPKPEIVSKPYIIEDLITKIKRLLSSPAT